MPPVVTALYGALNALFNILLAFRVTRVRDKHHVSLGAGEAPEMLVAIRAHANNAEYVPLALVLLLVTELCGGASMWLHAFGGGLLLARVAHAVGLPRKAPNPLRWGGTALTFTGIAVNAGYLLYLRFSF
jgi:uncharacterized membrane protein YecN with MAPEG domain